VSLISKLESGKDSSPENSSSELDSDIWYSRKSECGVDLRVEVIAICLSAVARRSQREKEERRNLNSH